MAHILLIGYDPLIGRATKAALEGIGHTVWDVRTPGEGVDILEQHPVKVILNAFRSSILNGHLLLRRVKDRYPDMKIVGVSDSYRPEDFPGLAFDGFLSRPCSCSELIAIIQRILAESDRSHGDMGPVSPADQGAEGRISEAPISV